MNVCAPMCVCMCVNECAFACVQVCAHVCVREGREGIEPGRVSLKEARRTVARLTLLPGYPLLHQGRQGLPWPHGAKFQRDPLTQGPDKDRKETPLGIYSMESATDGAGPVLVSHPPLGPRAHRIHMF